MTNWEDNFDALLAWLDRDPEKAGRKYEEIRHSLILIFERRSGYDAEDLADEAISRVLRKLPELAKEFKGDPALYFFGVAKRLNHEVTRRQQARVDLEDPDKLSAPLVIDELDEQDAEYDCLEKCLAKLTPADRELILLYYQQEKPNISFRRELALRYGLTLNALRVKVHRIRESLEKCINKCLGNAT
ncbi:MAG TPA: sigma-70 family RNA polymerase sigma factor [Pyrinomonadaceae bacterium]|nr:sigma-70 family RNA polymerase sigma factor [Pyrinomonadaceae bacterium]